jgi:signal transduction histidine kinase
LLKRTGSGNRQIGLIPQKAKKKTGLGKKIYKLKKIFAKTIGWSYTAFGCSLVVMMLLAWLCYRQYNAVSQYSGEVEHTYKTISAINRFSGYFKDMEIIRQDYLLTGDTGFRRTWQELSHKTKASLDTLAALGSDNPGLPAQIAGLRSIAGNRWLESGDSLWERNTTGRSPVTAAGLQQSRAVADSVQALVANITRKQLALLQQRNTARDSYRATAPRVLVVALSVFTCILLVSFVFIVLEMRKRMRYQVALEASNYSLQANNEELGQMAKVISHDLQEPLRKIRTFSNRLVLKYHEQLSEEVKMLLGRMDESVLRMQGLVEDLMNYISLNTHNEPPAAQSLNSIWNKVLQAMAPEINARGAVVSIGPLEKLVVYEQQLFIAFAALLENALKFAKPGTRPQVTVSGMGVNGHDVEPGSSLADNRYYVVRVEDKGIGFNNAFSEKIFEIFQRLHTGEQEFEGKGIGLAIVQKVMHNHRGYVTARGMEQSGAVFFLYFPL